MSHFAFTVVLWVIFIIVAFWNSEDYDGLTYYCLRVAVCIYDTYDYLWDGKLFYKIAKAAYFVVAIH